MESREEEFMMKLRELLAEYDAYIEYTNRDDGLHVYVGEKEVYRGWDLTIK